MFVAYEYDVDCHVYMEGCRVSSIECVVLIVVDKGCVVFIFSGSDAIIHCQRGM